MFHSIVNFVLIAVGIAVAIRCNWYGKDFVERKFLATGLRLEWLRTKSRLKIKKKQNILIGPLFFKKFFFKKLYLRSGCVSNDMTMMT